MKKVEIQDFNSSLPSTPIKSKNSMFRSHYLSNSVKVQSTPQVFTTFFNNKPLERYHRDISHMRPISRESPGKDFLGRKYIVVEQKVTYGKPMTVQQYNLLKKNFNPQIVTYGTGSKVTSSVIRETSVVKEMNVLRESKVGARIPVEIKTQAQTKQGWCCCGGFNKQSKSLVNKYQ